MSPVKMMAGAGNDFAAGNKVSDRMAEFMLELDEEGGGRRMSRARKQVNYALPNLRDKMRRGDNPDEKGLQRSKSTDRSMTPDMEVVVFLFCGMKLTLDCIGGKIYEAAYKGDHRQN